MSTKLYRPKNNRVIGGVCASLAQDHNIDPLVVRVVFGCLLFSPMPIFLIYLLLWGLIPNEGE